MGCCKPSRLLVASLLLNAFLAGMLISPVLNGHQTHGFGPHGPQEAMMAAVKDLSPESQTKVRAIISRYKPDQADPRKQLEDLRTILTSPDFDMKKFEAAESRLHMDEAKMRGNISAMVHEIVNALPAEERIEFFKKSFPPPPENGPPGPPRDPE